MFSFGPHPVSVFVPLEPFLGHEKEGVSAAIPVSARAVWRRGRPPCLLAGFLEFLIALVFFAGVSFFFAP